MNFLIEIIKFIFYCAIIILVSKYILVTTLRKLAENLNLKAEKVGEIAGYATSMPELLTIGASSFNGLTSASIYNVISSNVINLVQYMVTIILNKNQKMLKNEAIKLDIILVILSIIIPTILVFLNIEMNLILVPIFIIVYLIFRYISNNAHKLYLKKQEEQIDKIEAEEIEKEGKWERGNKKKTIKYVIYLFITGIILFFAGNRLGDTLENLCNSFNVPQIIVGILLGFITSIPELITFSESQKHHNQESSNNILGVVEATNNLFTSNILNLFIIQTVGILIFVIFA